MVATLSSKKSASRKERSSETRSHAPARTIQMPAKTPIIYQPPAAGAHAALHLVNEDATPGAGVLPSHAAHGREVDGAAG